ncbi:MAG: glutathione S-transferase family protein [Alphaproteobacteria bacterium]
MGQLVNGVWKVEKLVADRGDGSFRRADASLRNWVTADGGPGPSGEGGFKAEAGRYHLYVSLACPWAHRTLILRELKGLGAMIGVSVVHWLMGDHGWTFETGDGATGDHLFGLGHLHQIYTRAHPDYTGRVTVPVLWDKEQGTIVSNESSEIIRMLNSAFDGIGAIEGDFYPEARREAVDEINAEVYDNVNNGVYKSGFATSQEAYEDAVLALFRTLERLEARLSEWRYLVGEQITEADWRLFTTLVRFDPVYVGHFKCNLKRLVDFPSLFAYARELYQWPGIKETVDFHHIKNHYYASHTSINPTQIVPKGPVMDWAEPHGRDGRETRTD